MALVYRRRARADTRRYKRISSSSDTPDINCLRSFTFLQWSAGSPLLLQEALSVPTSTIADFKTFKIPHNSQVGSRCQRYHSQRDPVVACCVLPAEKSIFWSDAAILNTLSSTSSDSVKLPAVMAL